MVNTDDILAGGMAVHLTHAVMNSGVSPSLSHRLDYFGMAPYCSQPGPLDEQ